ncbi:hypothetical protein GGI12_000875 [Dipsacomyces acuminosporus]|nr:hypothetical protein GGI12_000875 [Dipsacomyces acuminosporus]
MEHIGFFESFPLLLPESLDPLRADGYIEVNGTCISLSVDVSLAGGSYCVEAVKSTAEIEQYLHGKRDELNTRFKQCASALSFVRELQHSLELFATKSRTRISPFYSLVIKQCDDIVGWDCVQAFDSKTQIMTIGLCDQSGRSHEIHANFAKETFTSTVDGDSVPMDAGLSKYIDMVKKKCLQLADCWAMLDDVDASLCVLQPQHPKRSDLWRRIAAGELLTALFEVSPDRYYPKLVIYGPKGAAGPLNLKAKSIRNQW